MNQNHSAAPADGIAGLRQNWKQDLLSGFIISLIALPLCLGIALASGVPPIAGLIAGIIGGIVLSLAGGSQLTINGPAAGLAVIVLTSIEGFKEMAPPGLSPEQVDMFAYQCTLAIGVACGLLQLLFGLVKAGIFSYFFPSSVVHGALASIGIMIFFKQFHVALGVRPEGSEMWEVIAAVPASVMNLNPEIAIISVVSFIILLGVPLLKIKWLKVLPLPLLVVAVAIPLGHLFDLEHEHKYLFLSHHEYNLGPRFLVSMPENLMDGIVFPRFDFLFNAFALKMIITYALVASLESLLTAAAIDKKDPWNRVSNFNRELVSKGAGNVLSSMLGGLPIIAEVVRSTANVANGGKTRWANFFHGIFLLLFSLFLVSLIHQIPMAAMAAILMVTGYRLASPVEFSKIWYKGREQMAIFLVTIIFAVVTDLLIGILAGIIVKLIIHVINGVPLKSLFRPFFTIIKTDDGIYTIDVEHSAVFSNYIGLKKQLDNLPSGKQINIDFTNTKLVDHTVIEQMNDFIKKYMLTGGTARIIGLSEHRPLSEHPHAGLKKRTKERNSS